jgi:hypothetical protein
MTFLSRAAQRVFACSPHFHADAPPSHLVGHDCGCAGTKKAVKSIAAGFGGKRCSSFSGFGMEKHHQAVMFFFTSFLAS